ncbi:MAG: zinc ribbon domain-containing protein [Vicinamibacterales bacterium]
MPLYEYACDAHQHRFEVIQKFSDGPVTVCPTCGSSVRKLISAPSFQLKGTGWYITDYAKKDSGGESAKSEGKNKETATVVPDKNEKAEKPESAEKTRTVDSVSKPPATPAANPDKGSA